MNTGQTKMTVKKMTVRLIKRVVFFFTFRHLTKRDTFKGLLLNIYLMLELLYHKRNPHITTIVDGSI